ncbi:MAG: M20/M25/M40 family metallo-hydrolase [Propionibacteriaceae bacterium]|nr:M20/M25/M40 family metallo-hydrolase [Propionibacteriaceae bacterium]
MSPTYNERVIDDALAQLGDLIRFDTSNFGPGEARGEREAAEYIAGKLDEVGIGCRLLESAPRRTTLVAEWAPAGVDESVPPLLIHGHTDVVPAVKEDWQVDPFSAAEQDGCIWGRGAVDMKDFDAMVLAVVRDRVRTHRPPRRPIRLVFTADEECGGKFGSHWLVDNHPELVADCPEAIGEVGGFSLTLPDRRMYLIQTAEKGLAWLRVIATGKTGHGSFRNAENAVTDLAQAIARVGAHRWPPRITVTQRRFLDALEDALQIQINYDDAETTLGCLGSISRMIGAAMSNSANPTLLQAGYKLNVIPGQAIGGLDGRFIPGYEDEFWATLNELLGEGFRIEPEQVDVAVETDFSGALVDAMTASLQAEDPGSIAVPYMTSVGTDAKAWSRLGIRCFGFAPLLLPPDIDFVSLFHGVDERIPVTALAFGVRVLDRFLDAA